MLIWCRFPALSPTEDDLVPTFARAALAAVTALVGTAALTIITPSPASAATGPVSGRLSLGSFTSGQRKSGTWMNANSDAYQVGIVPSISDPWSCEFQLVKTVYGRNSNGTRQLTYEIENAGV